MSTLLIVPNVVPNVVSFMVICLQLIVSWESGDRYSRLYFLVRFVVLRGTLYCLYGVCRSKMKLDSVWCNPQTAAVVWTSFIGCTGSACAHT